MYHFVETTITLFRFREESDENEQSCCAGRTRARRNGASEQYSYREVARVALREASSVFDIHGDCE